jgi:hypothetical protein
MNRVLKMPLAAKFNDGGANFSSLPFKQSEHDGLTSTAASVAERRPRFFSRLRALPPMKVSSASTVPVILLKVPWCIAYRMRWSMNQAVF